MLQRQPWLSGPGSVADTVARTLLAIHGEQPLGSEKAHARRRATPSLSSKKECEDGKQVSRRRASALSRFNRMQRG